MLVLRDYALTALVSFSFLAPWCHPQGRFHRAVLQAPRRGVPGILSPVHLPSYAAEPMSVVGSIRGGEPYLAILKDKAETSCNSHEWAEGISRVSHPAKEQFGRSRLPVRLVLIRDSTQLNPLAACVRLISFLFAAAAHHDSRPWLGSGPDGPILSTLPPAPGLSALPFFPFIRRLILFFRLENESRRSSMSLSGRPRWWLR